MKFAPNTPLDLDGKLTSFKVCDSMLLSVSSRFLSSDYEFVLKNQAANPSPLSLPFTATNNLCQHQTVKL